MKRCLRIAAMLGLCTFSGNLIAQSDVSAGARKGRTELEAGASYDSLTNGQPDWRSAYVEAVHEFTKRHVLYGGVRGAQRFNLSDREAYGGLYYPLDATWTGAVDGSVSTHDFLPKASLGVQILKSLPDGWGVGLGLRHSEYTATAADTASATLERYWGNFRGAYTVYSGRPEGASSGAAHRFQFAYYYAERSQISIAYTTGREVENVGPPQGVVSSDVRDWTLFGRHWLAADWAVTYEFVNREQGTFYRRTGLRLGLRHSF